MEHHLDFYSLVGFSHETAAPENLDGLSISTDETALFLDFDGTLVDIADTPDAIAVSRSDRLLLDRLNTHFNNAVSVISGRNLRAIKQYLPSFSGTISGGHGAEICHNSGNVAEIECNFDRLEHIKKAAIEFAIIDPRVLAEEKQHGIVLHFRQHPELEGKVHDFLKSLIDGDDDFELQEAKMAVEVKPKGISKASAIENIMASDAFDGRTILFAGDDVTDEIAFNFVKERGGITIKVGEGLTAAQYRTASPATFKNWLLAQIAPHHREC